jgi:putative endonuclease
MHLPHHNPQPLSRCSKGQYYEQQARCFLEQQGLFFVCANYRCRQGEIDLIMQEHETLVFVEVRYRASRDYGGALASVTPAKQHKIRHTARYFLLNKQINEAHQACRFDIVSYDDGQRSWLKNAF